MRDIARRAGVSRAAVSYALNGQPGVSAATRRRVLHVAAEIGFEPNAAAKAVRGAGAQTVGLVLGELTGTLSVEAFRRQFISGVEAELAAQSYGLLLRIAANSAAEIEAYQRWWAQRRVDGVILCDPLDDDPRLRALARLAIPAVVIGGPVGDGAVTSLWSDDAFSIGEAVGHLASLGHHRIAHVSGPTQLRHSQIRSAAFRDACAGLGIAAESREVTADYTGDDGARASRRLLSSIPRPTAIIYDNDVMALAGLAVAVEMGFSVPADVSLVAWEDSALCQVVRPPLTVLRRDVIALGRRAAQLLLAAIGGEPPHDLEYGTARLLPRASVAAPAATG
jgi:DNA-binding LacI/PurR family transcriptional regulator